MKYKALTMIVICMFVCVVVFSQYGAATLAYAQSQTSSDSSDINSWQVLEDFVTNNPNRQYNTDGERKAGDYIQTKFTQAGLQVNKQQLSTDVQSYNIIGKLDVANTDKTIVIGAHYDSVGGEGATDNGSGVAALLVIAQRLVAVRQSLSVDIEFVAFAGEEEGLYGSIAYCNALNQMQKQNIFLMVNIDSIAAGDNLYIYGENRRTDFVNLFLQSAQDSAFTLQQKPLYKDLYFGVDMWGYGYYQPIQNSDQTPFRLNGIPTVFFYSGSYSNFLGKYTESAIQANNVMNTSADTLQHLQQLGTQVVIDKIDTVVNSVVNAVSASNFYDVAVNARSELVSNAWYNILYPTITVGVLLIFLLIGTLLYYRKLDKQSILGESKAKGTEHKIFTAPDAKDIFDMDDK